MRKSISVAFFSTVSTLMVLGIVLMGGSEWLLFSNYFAKDRYATLDEVVNVTRRTAQYLVQEAALPEGEELDTLSTKLEIIGESAEAYLFFTDNEGNVLIASNPDKLSGCAVPEAVLQKTDAAPENYHLFSTMDGVLTEKSYVSASELRSERGGHSGYVFLCSSGEQLTEFKQQFWSNFLLSACVMLLCASILTKILMRQLTDPLQKVTDAAQRFGGGDLSVRDVHAQHGRVERDARAVLHGVFRVGDRQPVGADAAGVWIRDGKAGLGIEVRLAAQQLLAGDELGVGDAVVILAPHAVAPHGRTQPAVLEADILPHPLKGNIKFPAELIVHGISSADIVVLERAAGKIDAGVDLAVIATGSLQCQIGFLFHQQDIQLPFGKLPGDGGPGNAPADDEDIRLSAFQRGIPQSGDADGLLPCLIAADLIDHMGGTVFFGCQGTGFHRFRPGGQMPRKHDAVIR